MCTSVMLFDDEVTSDPSDAAIEVAPPEEPEDEFDEADENEEDLTDEDEDE
jgi:hypothetical protein